MYIFPQKLSSSHKAFTCLKTQMSHISHCVKQEFFSIILSHLKLVQEINEPTDKQSSWLRN